MSKEKEQKVFQLIGLCLVLLIVLVIMLVMVLSGYIAEDIIAYGRHNHGTRALSEDPLGYGV